MQSAASAQSAKAAMQQDPACQSLTPVSAGGPAPKDPNTVVVRWLSFTNYELAYRDQVFLLDTYFDQPPRRHSPGVAVKDFKKANAIFIGHAHFDHMSDAASVASRTGAVVVGAPVTTEKLLAQNVDRSRVPERGPRDDDEGEREDDGSDSSPVAGQPPQ